MKGEKEHSKWFSVFHSVSKIIGWFARVGKREESLLFGPKKKGGCWVRFLRELLSDRSEGQKITKEGLGLGRAEGLHPCKLSFVLCNLP